MRHKVILCVVDVDVISKFAQCEFKYGEVERGCTMFDNLLSSYPKRVDVWSVYIDTMCSTKKMPKIRCSSVHCIVLPQCLCRELFERVINLKLSTKKMKFFFKKYLEFEQKYGSLQTVSLVKDKATSYVEQRKERPLV